jgi:hypothetical protein
MGGVRITGYVRDRAGAPVAGACVRIGRAVPAIERALGGRETTSEASGAYEFDDVDAHLPDWPSPRIWATHPRAGASLATMLPDHDASIDLTLLGAGSVAGIAKTALSDAHVVARRSDAPDYVQVTRTAWGGAFRFDDLPPGDYAISLPDYDATTAVTVVDGETATVVLAVPVLVRLRIKVTGRPHPSESSGQPTLEAIAPHSKGRLGGISRSLNIVGSNFFSFSQDVPPGNYRFSPDGTTWTSITVQPSPREQTIQISTPPSLPKV